MGWKFVGAILLNLGLTCFSGVSFSAALLTENKNNVKNRELKRDEIPAETPSQSQHLGDETRVELIPKIAAAEEGDLFFGKYGKVHRLQTDQDAAETPEVAESKFARDFVRLHLANAESQTRRRRKRSVIGRDASQPHIDLSPNIHEREATESPFGEEGTVPTTEDTFKVVTRKVTPSVSLTTGDIAGGDGAVSLRIVADKVDYHDVVFEELTNNEEVRDEKEEREGKQEGEVEIVEMEDPEVEPAHRIKLDDVSKTDISEVLLEPATTTAKAEPAVALANATDAAARPELRGTVPKQYDIKMKREKIKEMMLHSWNNYVLYAWGDNELRPVTRQPHRANIYGSARLGATIIDSLSTLYTMGLESEFNRGRDWVATDLKMDYNAFVSVFETNIRILGGLLSAYAMSGYTVFKTKSVEVANKMLPAFDTPTGIPYGLVSLQTGQKNNWMWAQGQSILAEFGTLHLEFVYLSNITGLPIYAEKVKHIRNYMDKIRKPNYGLYPNYLNPQTGTWGSHHVSIGALGDSFYEYLLKSWIQTGKKDAQARRMYDDAMQRMSQVLFKRSHPSNLLYVAEYDNTYLKHHMGHLACFAGGMFGLSAKEGPSEQKWMQIAKDIAYTCKQSYNRTGTGIGPEGFDFNPHSNSIHDEAVAAEYGSRYYALRPEVIETWFYLWRLTKDDIYRQWAWDFALSLERFCRAPNGFSGIRDVYDVNTDKDNTQQSFFLAETLKYLYLIFSEDDTLPLDDWVFNTEAHPLPILHDYPEDNLPAADPSPNSAGHFTESPLWINP